MVEELVKGNGGSKKKKVHVEVHSTKKDIHIDSLQLNHKELKQLLRKQFELGDGGALTLHKNDVLVDPAKQNLNTFYYTIHDDIWFKYNKRMAAPLNNPLSFDFGDFHELKAGIYDVDIGMMDDSEDEDATTAYNILDYLFEELKLNISEDDK